MTVSSISAHDLSSGDVDDIKSLGTFEQVQHSASSEPVTTILPITVSDLRQWYTKAIKDATSDSEPEEFAKLKIGVGVLPEWKGNQKAEWDCTGNMITSIEASDWYTMGGLCEFNALPVYRRTKFKTREGPLECLKYFVMYFGTFNLSWIYLPTRRTTIAVLRCISIEGEREVRNMLNALKSGRGSLTHPLHIGIIAHHQITQQLQTMIRRHQQNVIEAQFLTGFHDYTNVLRAQADLKNTDVSKASFDLVSSATTLGTAEEGCKGAIDLAKFFREENEHFAVVSRRSGLDVDEYLQDEIDQAAKRCLRRAEAAGNKSMLWQKKAAVVMQGLFNLIAQRDQNVSIALAEATKRDSTSMKSIAAVTMIFLPGTFTASLFATPWFADSRAPLLARMGYFWFYWIVTVPLTVMTLVCWAIWIRYARQMEMQADAGKTPTAKRKWIEIMRLFTKMSDVDEMDKNEAAEERKAGSHVLPYHTEKTKQSGAVGELEGEMMMNPWLNG